MLEPQIDTTSLSVTLTLSIYQTLPYWRRDNYQIDANNSE